MLEYWPGARSVCCVHKPKQVIGSRRRSILRDSKSYWLLPIYIVWPHASNAPKLDRIESKSVEPVRRCITAQVLIGCDTLAPDILVCRYLSWSAGRPIPSTTPYTVETGPSFMPTATNFEQTRSFSHDLAQSLAHAWRLLERGTADRHSPFHTPTVATVAADGTPEIRTVVLRKVEAAQRTVRFHTDRRSRKVEALAANPRLALHGYDPAAKIQIRLLGQAHVHQDDDVAHLAWSQSKSMSLMCYRQSRAPGAAIAAPLAAPGTIKSEVFAPMEGFENFAAVMLTVRSLEWLFLASGGHQRAQFTWDADNQLSQTWLAP
jgi:pyridoxamine 5'-phosphate oxidase